MLFSPSLDASQIFDVLEQTLIANDATVSVSEEGASIEFDKTARSFTEAVLRGIKQLESVDDVFVDRVDTNDVVTASEIASRVGRSRESVRLLANSERGPGDFPKPVGFLDANTRAWRWSDVAQWFSKHGEVTDELAHYANFIAAINAALAARRLKSRLPSKKEQNAVMALANDTSIPIVA